MYVCGAQGCCVAQWPNGPGSDISAEDRVCTSTFVFVCMWSECSVEEDQQSCPPRTRRGGEPGLNCPSCSTHTPTPRHNPLPKSDFPLIGLAKDGKKKPTQHGVVGRSGAGCLLACFFPALRPAPPCPASPVPGSPARMASIHGELKKK